MIRDRTYETDSLMKMQRPEILLFNFLKLSKMKKLKLEELNLGNAGVLSREELKTVLGGAGSGDGTDCGTVDNCSSKACTAGGNSGTCGTYGGHTSVKTCGCISAGLGS